MSRFLPAAGRPALFTALVLASIIGQPGCQPKDTDQSEESIVVDSRPVPASPPAPAKAAPSLFAEGHERAQQGDLAAAEAAYREAVRENKFQFEAWYNLGLLLYQQGRLDEAREAFLMVADNTRAARFNRVYYQLGLIAADQGDDATAVKYYTESELLDPSHAPSYINMGAAFLRMEEYSRAGEQLEKAAALDPGNRNVWFNLGLLAYREGAIEEARTHFHRAAYLDPDQPYPEAHYMLGKAFSDEGRYNAAVNEYEIALRLRPDYPEAAYNLALNLDRSGDQAAAVELYKTICSRADAPAEALNNLAVWHLGRGEPSAAVPLLKRALEQEPAYATAAYNLGIAELRLDNYAEAVDAFAQAVQADPENFAAWKNLGIAHARQEAYEPALEAMQRAFKLDPSDADTAVYLVKYLKLLDKPVQMVTDTYRAAYAAGARNPLMLGHLAAAAFDSGDYPEAARFYSECIRLRPTTAHVYNLGLARLRMNDIAGAIASFRQAIELDPRHFPSWKNLGIAYSRIDDTASALSAMQQAFLLDPSDSDTAVYVVKYLKLLDRPDSTVSDVYRTAYAAGARDVLMLRHLAREAMDAGDFNLAATYYQDYVKLRPSAPYFFNLGLALRKAGRLEEARIAYGQAIKEDPGFTKAWVNLGYIHAFLGDEAAAQAAFSKALAIDPEYDNAKSALAELRAGLIKP